MYKRQLLDGMTETVYRNTWCIGQHRSGTEESLAQALSNYMAGYEETGDTTLDVSEAVKCLKENRKDLNARKKTLKLEWEKPVSYTHLRNRAAGIWDLRLPPENNTECRLNCP